MATIRLYMSMSLDGFIAGPDDRPGQELGRGGGRLFNWLDTRLEPGPNGEVFAEALATGAVISGRRTYELAGRWQGDHHDGVPVHVLTHHPDDEPPGSVRYYTDVVACATDARAAAGDRAVLVHGASAARARRGRCWPQDSSTSWRSTWCPPSSATAVACSAPARPRSCT